MAEIPIGSLQPETHTITAVVGLSCPVNGTIFGMKMGIWLLSFLKVLIQK